MLSSHALNVPTGGRLGVFVDPKQDRTGDGPGSACCVLDEGFCTPNYIPRRGCIRGCIRHIRMHPDTAECIRLHLLIKRGK